MTMMSVFKFITFVEWCRISGSVKSISVTTLCQWAESSSSGRRSFRHLANISVHHPRGISSVHKADGSIFQQHVYTNMSSN